METSQTLVSAPANSWLTSILGASFLTTLMQNAYLLDSLRLLIMGTVIETGRRLCQWLMERFSFRMFHLYYSAPKTDHRTPLFRDVRHCQV
jgi:hypothetical protein